MFPIISLARNIVSSNISELKVPYKLTYALTYRCQLKCRMCDIWKKTSYPEMTVEQISEFFKRSKGLSWINLSGGEMFLRPDVLDILRAIRVHGKNVYLLNFPTNGYQTDVIVPALKEIIKVHRFPKVLVTVSIDGPPLLHDQIRNTPGSWARAMETYQQLRRLKNRHFDVFIGMTLQSANQHAFEETLHAADKQIGNVAARDIHVNIAHASSHYYGNAGQESSLDREKTILQIKRIWQLRTSLLPGPVNYLERRYQKQAAAYLGGQRAPFHCQAFGASLFMDPDGTVYPCTMYDRPIGNIRDFGYDLRTLWNDGLRSGVRREILSGHCPGCWTPCEAYQSILANVFRVPR